MARLRRYIVSFVLAALPLTVYAQRAGDWVVGAGVLSITPEGSGGPLYITAPVQESIPGSGATVRNTTTLGLDLDYFVTDNIAVEALMGVPPSIKLDGRGTLGAVGRLGQARLFAPAVLGKYFFGQSDERLRISLGVGVNYSTFRDTQLTQGLQDAIGSVFAIPAGASSTVAHISSKWAPVFNAGANYAITRRFGISASLSYIPLDVHATLDTSVAGIPVARSTARIGIDPLVEYVYATYRF